MKLLSAVLGSLLLIRGESMTAGDALPAMIDEYDEYPLAPLPPAPGSDAVLPGAYWEFYRRQEEREEREERGVRLSSSSPPPPLRHDGHASEGTYKNLVLLLRFADHDEEDLPRREDILTLLNDDIGVDPARPLEMEEGNEVNPTGSVREVFAINSHGALRFEGTVTEWITLDHDEAHYASDAEGTGQSGLSKSRFRDGIREALGKLAADPEKYAPAGFDLDAFDYNAKDELDGFGVLHSGHGAEYGGDEQTARIWSHKSSGLKWAVPDSLLPARREEEGSGVRLRGGAARQVNKFYVAAALHGKDHTGMLRFGVLVHEVGHSFGLPDLYDTSFAGKGIGKYDVMSTGNYEFDGTGYYPSSMSAWTKVYLGWAEAVEITEDGTYTLEAASEGKHQVYKIAHGFPGGDKPEYILLENRQPVGYDSTMEGGGIAIYHVDEGKRKQKNPGYPGQESDDGEDFPANNQHYRKFFDVVYFACFISLVLSQRYCATICQWWPCSRPTGRTGWRRGRPTAPGGTCSGTRTAC